MSRWLARLLSGLLLVGLVLVFAGMAAANWGEAPVDFVTPDGTVLAVRLPLLLLAAFAAGWLPPWLWHVARLRLGRRAAADSRLDPAPPPA